MIIASFVARRHQCGFRRTVESDRRGLAGHTTPATHTIAMAADSAQTISRLAAVNVPHDQSTNNPIIPPSVQVRSKLTARRMRARARSAYRVVSASETSVVATPTANPNATDPDIHTVSPPTAAPMSDVTTSAAPTTIGATSPTAFDDAAQTMLASPRATRTSWETRSTPTYARVKSPNSPAGSTLAATMTRAALPMLEIAWERPGAPQRAAREMPGERRPPALQ